MRTPIADAFGIEFPIFAFSHCRDVVAAITNAGGFGVLGAAAFLPEELEIELAWIDDHVGGKPYGVDVLMPASSMLDAGVELGGIAEQLTTMIPDGHRRFVDDFLARHDVPALPDGVEPAKRFLGLTHQGARSQLEIALAHPVSLVVNALGPPPADVVELVHGRGIKVGALVGSAAHAVKQIDNGVDVLVAQGTEAGGHTGEITSMVLIPEVVEAVHPAPVLAAGGIGTGRQVAAAMALGAQGVWTGSIWLTVRESDTPPALMEKLLAARSNETVRSRSWSGKPIRMLRTAWSEAWDGPDSPGALPAPLQAVLFEEAAQRILRSKAADLSGTPVGQIVGRMNAIRSARDVFFDLIDEYLKTVSELADLTDLDDGSGAR
ncbi:MAG TPA: nitronate monooxygenase [Actinomycetota bacterium]|nr:nitronate monooxygenase [Actinomycetota bacterium]